MEVLFIISSILFAALEIFLIVFLIFKIKRYRRLTLKDTIVYGLIDKIIDQKCIFLSEI